MAEVTDKRNVLILAGKGVAYGFKWGFEKLVELLVAVFNTIFAKTTSALGLYVALPAAILGIIG